MCPEMLSNLYVCRRDNLLQIIMVELENKVYFSILVDSRKLFMKHVAYKRHIKYFS